MNFRRRQLLGRGLIALAVLLGGAWLARLDFAQKLSHDVLDLIPRDEREPELQLVRSLAGEAESRSMFFVITDAGGKPARAEAAEKFADALRRDPVFDQVQAMGASAPREAIGRELFEARFTLLFPRWMAEKKKAHAAAGAAAGEFSPWLAAGTVDELGRFLQQPEALAFQELIPNDPLLLLPRVVERFQGVAGPVGSSDASAALVWARLAVSPMVEAGQGPAFAAIDRAAGELRREFPGYSVAYTGVNRFAASSRARIEKELAWLNTLSVLTVLGVAAVFIRGVHRGLHLLPVVLLSLLGAWVCATVVFPQVHILVFVVGSLLTGVAIDYGFYLYMQPPAFPEEDYWGKVRRLAKPLLASCLTTVAGFALLLFSELPFIRQLGVYVGSGLVCALASAVVYFSTVRDPFLPAREFGFRRLLRPSQRLRARRGLMALWLVALAGLLRLSWRDDIRQLDIPSAELNRNDAYVRGFFGQQSDRTVYLTYGPTVQEARASLEKFEAWLDSAGQGNAQTLGLGAVVPTADETAQALRFLRENASFPRELRAALGAAGFDEQEFAPFFAAYERHASDARAADVAAAVEALQTSLTGPLGLLLHVGKPLSWFVTVTSRAPSVAPPPETSTVSESQLQTLNRVFGRYRQSALWLSVIGLGLVGAGVFLTYGLRDGWRIFAIPCGACLGVFGLYGWLGQPLNLFHLLGAFLGVCLTHNYSIFTATSAYRGEGTPVSVRLSALTTGGSFGVLALSGIPVVHALGATVALMVVAALLAIEFEHLEFLGGKKS